MSAATPSEFAIGLAALAAIAGFLFWRLLVWIQHSPVHADPWDAATEEAVQQPDAVPVCHHCLTQVPPGQWFCESCGSAVGPYNNYMPYLNCFSEGEVYRNGVTAWMPCNILIVLGYLFLSLSLFVLAPVYWMLLIRNLRQRHAEATVVPGEGTAI